MLIFNLYNQFIINGNVEFNNKRLGCKERSWILSVIYQVSSLCSKFLTSSTRVYLTSVCKARRQSSLPGWLNFVWLEVGRERGPNTWADTTAHCISLQWEGDLRNLSYFLNKRKELEFYNCHPTEDKESSLGHIL